MNEGGVQKAYPRPPISGTLASSGLDFFWADRKGNMTSPAPQKTSRLDEDATLAVDDGAMRAQLAEVALPTTDDDPTRWDPNVVGLPRKENDVSSEPKISAVAAADARRASASKAVVDPLIGRVLQQRYRIEAPLAQGGMGRLYRAIQEPLGRVVAVKVLTSRGDNAGEALFRKRFFLEAESSARINHPHAITLHDYGCTDDGVYFIVMEYLNGETLRQMLDRVGRIQPARAVRLAVQVARALRAAHHQGLVHRDLKPSNIMLVQHDEDIDFVKVFDFGLVRDLSCDREITRAGVFLGSPCYMAPEQVRSAPAGPAADIYALGAVLVEMINGKSPFRRENTLATLRAHIHEEPPKVLFGPTELGEICRRCLAKEPDDRFATMEEAIDALRGLARSQSRKRGRGKKARSKGRLSHTQSKPKMERKELLSAVPLEGASADAHTQTAERHIQQSVWGDKQDVQSKLVDTDAVASQKKSLRPVPIPMTDDDDGWSAVTAREALSKVGPAPVAFRAEQTRQLALAALAQKGANDAAGESGSPDVAVAMASLGFLGRGALWLELHPWRALVGFCSIVLMAGLGWLLGHTVWSSLGMQNPLAPAAMIALQPSPASEPTVSLQESIQPSQGDTAVKEPLTVVIDTYPRGAQISLDGQHFCSATPCRGFWSSSSTAVVIDIALPGYAPVHRIQTLTSEGLELHVALLPKAP